MKTTGRSGAGGKGRRRASRGSRRAESARRAPARQGGRPKPSAAPKRRAAKPASPTARAAAPAPSATAAAPATVPATPQPVQPPQSPRRARLESLLVEAIHQMDEDGMVFLLKQADVLRTNANSARIRHEIEEYEAEHGAGSATGDEEPELPKVTVEPSKDGKAYFLALDKVRKVLTRSELGRIVQVCLKASNREAAGRALYRALGSERSDILVDARISGPHSPILRSLYATILDLSRQARA